MRYVTSVERIATERGLENGMQQGMQQTASTTLIEILEIRFGTVPEPVVKAISAIDDPLILNKLLRQVVMAESLDEFKPVYA